MFSFKPNSLKLSRNWTSPAEQTGDVGEDSLDSLPVNAVVLEPGDTLHHMLQDLGIKTSAHFNEYNSHTNTELSSGRYNLAFVCFSLGREQISKLLRAHTHSHSLLSVVVVNGPSELMFEGAADCIPEGELTNSRVNTLLINSERFRKLQQTAGTLFSDIGALHAKDSLTQLANRQSFSVHLNETIKTSMSNNEPVSLITLDLDSFKGLNESKGHGFGDQILRTVADRLKQFAPENSLVGRLGDDEFALLLHGEHLSRVSDTTIAARLSHELRQPYFIDEQSTALSATMGIAKLEPHDTAETLLHKAVSALYTAKREKNRFMVYTKREDTERRHQLRLAQELPNAIENNQLRLHYQPMIRMHDSTVVGVEALVRWQHPEKGLLFPDSFIPLAEGSGNVESLTRWVLDAAIRQGSNWLKQGHRLSMSVNISALILHNPVFPDIVNRLLEQSQFPAELLKLEITESAIISDVVRASDVLMRLHELGLKISIDDFGTGYTSLAYIRKLPVDEIKIDKSFVLNMNSISDDAVIVRTLLELARNLDLAVVAEGVEDRETWYMLAGLGCHVAQGYYMSRPVDVEALENWLQTSPWAGFR
ncbi:putative bifunctional diguanylate cyclase/phosphodiesterase [Sneathiella aquimaris]|uniref:putative bifunctional diguanylate cyclase/phosphodiesterase n=1 Tax=Sneathiella aquimaris TaxID=2599305 RepID=UPI00146F621A|nr:bifunctional diguanylate cyclase/phosphodiesterase [Sneathiella aquimaris]